MVLFIHYVVCRVKGVQPLPKRFLQRARSIVSSCMLETFLFLKIIKQLFRSFSSFSHSFHISFCLSLNNAIQTAVSPSYYQSSQTSFLLIHIRFYFLLLLCVILCHFSRWVHIIFSIPLQHHISHLSRYFSSTFEVFKFQHHKELCSKCSNSIAS